jgi:hypothetical protein
MTLESWKNEYWPQGVGSDTATEKELLDLELQMWVGFRKENRKKHGLVREDDTDTLWDKETNQLFYLEGETSPLCSHYFAYEKHGIAQCVLCPLYEMEDGGVSCFDTAEFDAFVKDDDPEPMIELLKSIPAKENKS